MMVILSYEMIFLYIFVFFCHFFCTAFARHDFWARGAILITLPFVAAFAEQSHKRYSYIMQSWENKIQLCQSLPPFNFRNHSPEGHKIAFFFPHLSRSGFERSPKVSSCHAAQLLMVTVKPSSALKFGVAGWIYEWQNNFVFT